MPSSANNSGDEGVASPTDSQATINNSPASTVRSPSTGRCSPSSWSSVSSAPDQGYEADDEEEEEVEEEEEEEEEEEDDDDENENAEPEEEIDAASSANLPHASCVHTVDTELVTLEEASEPTNSPERPTREQVDNPLDRVERQASNFLLPMEADSEVDMEDLLLALCERRGYNWDMSEDERI
ncbi:uncharacterized protein N7482_010333 [Penicillium canariense]|uniref:Uncharacterized protein n=1 Tax=Penicillium canariense TaxID=189055 RepID=A0A9W9HMC8_9EURO|nr:uncharacterized protein N7482_010333 [Penicillium canariense]KAJ5151081.1 hypothetical protein N7482_010333 [Penicillium canariense]